MHDMHVYALVTTIKQVRTCIQLMIDSSNLVKMKLNKLHENVIKHKNYWLNNYKGNVYILFIKNYFQNPEKPYGNQQLLSHISCLKQQFTCVQLKQ